MVLRRSAFVIPNGWVERALLRTLTLDSLLTLDFATLCYPKTRAERAFT
jgi:hypothetical protein